VLPLPPFAFRLQVVHDSGVFAGHRGAVFIDLYSRSRDMSVITVRGTNPKNLADMFQDAMLFNSAFLWDLSGMVGGSVTWMGSPGWGRTWWL
jgi:hypothetical protein